MRVDSAKRGGYAAAAGSARRAATAGFTVAESAGPMAAGGASAPRAVATLSALMALQSVEEPGERRNRAVKRGRATLDALEELKLGLLSGGLDGAAVARLRAASSGLGEASGDAGLDSVLAEVELRAAVELAKFAAQPVTSG